MPIKETIEYHDADQALEGWVVRERGCSKTVPGVLVFHEFMGLGAYLDRHLENLAALGYVVMAADMYGKGIRPENAQAALAISRPFRDDRQAMRRRAKAAVDCMRCLSGVAPEKIAALGYSFGGCAALELARCGEDLKAAISFYGYLDAPIPAVPDTIKAKMLVFHGIHDPVVPMASLAAYCQEMAAVGADSRVVTYADAGYGFCNTCIDGRQNPWNRYSRHHDEGSWRTLVNFLRETLGA